MRNHKPVPQVTSSQRKNGYDAPVYEVQAQPQCSATNLSRLRLLCCRRATIVADPAHGRQFRGGSPTRAHRPPRPRQPCPSTLLSPRAAGARSDFRAMMCARRAFRRCLGRSSTWRYLGRSDRPVSRMAHPIRLIRSDLVHVGKTDCRAATMESVQMPLVPNAVPVDPRLSSARELMTQALQLLDEGAYHQPAAILDHALSALNELERTRLRAATSNKQP
jgi:hypothetical protein